MTHCIRGLYAVTPDTVETARLVVQVAAAVAGGACVVQYRNKTAGPALRLTQARALLEVCRGQGVPLIVNDHIDLALEIGADGVHLGSDDGPVHAARSMLGANGLLGVSCYDRLHNAMAAEQAGADYVAFGSFFASGIKPGAVRASPELLRAAKQLLKVPVVAIGGITRHNAGQLRDAGADAVAVISALFGAEDVEGAARQFGALFRATA